LGGDALTLAVDFAESVATTDKVGDEPVTGRSGISLDASRNLGVT
jgi:hypothetical protein